MKATRRSTVAASGFAALGLAGCTGAGSQPSSDGTPSTSAAATEAAPPDPDRVALDRAIALTTALLADLADSQPLVDVGGRFAEMHATHLAALQQATGSSATASPLPPTGRGLTAGQLRTRELGAQRELARSARTAESGPVARLLASMSAGIAAGLSRRGELTR